MAEAMTPDKSAAPTAERQALLRRIAKVAKHQGQYHLACKKYTQVSLEGIKDVLNSLGKQESGSSNQHIFQQGWVALLTQPEVIGARKVLTTWHVGP